MLVVSVRKRLRFVDSVQLPIRAHIRRAQNCTRPFGFGDRTEILAICHDILEKPLDVRLGDDAECCRAFDAALNERDEIGSAERYLRVARSQVALHALDKAPTHDRGKRTHLLFANCQHLLPRLRQRLKRLQQLVPVAPELRLMLARCRADEHELRRDCAAANAA